MAYNYIICDHMVKHIPIYIVEAYRLELTHSRVPPGCYPPVNVYITNWKFTMLLMAKATISRSF